MKKPTQKKTFVLEKIEGEKVYFSGENQAILPKKILPDDIKIGDQFVITAVDPKIEKEDKQITAKEILNEILKPKK